MRDHVFRCLISPLRDMVRLLQTQQPKPGAAARLLRGLAVIIPFGLIVVISRVWAKILGPPRIESRAHFGARMMNAPPDLVQLYIDVFRIWEPDLDAFMTRRLQPGDTFIDIGANVGYDTLLAAHRVGPTGRVVSIEASPAILERLRENVTLNAREGAVRIVHAAASDARGSLPLFAGPEHNLGLTSTGQHRGMQQRGTVDAAPLEDLVDDEELKRLRLIKIDVEGGEDRVLAGIARMIDRLPQDAEILVELSPAWWGEAAKTPQDVLEPFLEAGFNVYELPNSYWPWRYLWPRRVDPPRRVRRELRQRVARLDIVLSRVDAPTL